MNRREFLGAMAVAPLAISAQPVSPVRRTFEITTRIELPEEHDAAIAWVPLPLGRPAPYQIDRGHTLGGNAERSRVVRLPGSDTAVAVAEWGHMMPAPVFVVTARVETTNHRVALSPLNGAKRSADLAAYLKPAALIPLDGIVKETADDHHARPSHAAHAGARDL